MVGDGPLLWDSPARRGRTCPCRARYFYPNLLVLGVAEERRQLTCYLRVALVEREEIEAIMEAQAARIQELEVRVLEERQRADASHAQYQETEGRLIQIVQEVGNRADGIMAECGVMYDRIEEALLGDVPGEAAPAGKVEIAPIEEDLEEEPKENPSEAVGSSSSVHLY